MTVDLTTIDAPSPERVESAIVDRDQLERGFLRLDPEMRARLARLNPTASARVASRLLEACERQYWKPDDQVLADLRRAGEELEDRLEGVYEGAAA